MEEDTIVLNKDKMNRDSVYPLSDIEEAILITLEKGKELYGLEISNAIYEASEQKIQIKFGSLYPALRRLERKGFVMSRWGEDKPDDRGGARRRYYTIAKLGQHVLKDKRKIRKNIENYHQ